MTGFVYESMPSRVVFGDGALATLADEVDRLGLGRAMVLSTPEQRELAQSIADGLGTRAAGVYDRAVMHVPMEVAAAARTEAQTRGADGCVAVGGGSTIGLGKAIALAFDLPIIAVPTTYAGSEMTPIWGLTEDGVKRTGRDRRVLPRTVVYDPRLTMSLPVGMSVTSGLNAIAHAMEGLYAPDRNPITSMMAEDGIRAMARALPCIVADPADPQARADALYGAWLCGATLGMVSMSLHHKLCHTLGGSFNLPHAETHAVILPHAAAYNRAAAPEAMARMAAALGVEDAPAGLHALAKGLGAPTTLSALGMTEAQLDRAADLAVENPYWNPRPIERGAVRRLLDDAWHGRVPGRVPA